jgi:hypothetical protein
MRRKEHRQERKREQQLSVSRFNQSIDMPFEFELNTVRNSHGSMLIERVNAKVSDNLKHQLELSIEHEKTCADMNRCVRKNKNI